MNKKPLTFKKLRAGNIKRCEKYFHPLNDWSPCDWALAGISEFGEMGNYIKKLRRLEGSKSQGNNSLTREELIKAAKKEAGDVIAYLDLLCARLGFTLESAVVEKFNECSDRIPCNIKL